MRAYIVGVEGRLDFLRLGMVGSAAAAYECMSGRRGEEMRHGTELMLRGVTIAPRMTTTENKSA
jgi:hypothetical protein